MKGIENTMENIMVKGTNWIKGFALFGMMVALVGMLAVAPGASAASARLSASPVPISNPGKISVFAHEGTSLTGIADATVIVRQYNSDVVILKGTTDASGRFASYIAEGVYQVTITAKGYKEFSQVVKVASGQGTSLAASLEVGPSDN